MSYGTLVAELARKLGKLIIAYDNLPDHGGCILHVRGSGLVKRLDIEVAALDEDISDLAAFVRRIIAESPALGAHLRIGMRDGQLAVLPRIVSSDEQAIPMKKSAVAG